MKIKISKQLEIYGKNTCSPLRRNPFVADQKVSDDLQAEHVVVIAEEEVEEEQLGDGVEAVAQLDDDVAARQVVAVQTAGHEDAVTRQQLTGTRHAAGATISTSHQIAVQKVNGVPSLTRTHSHNVSS